MPTQNQNTNLDDILNRVTVETTILRKEDILSILSDSLEKNELFAKEFKEKVIKPLVQKIERKIRIDEIFVDGKKIGKSISDSMIKESKTSIEQATKKLGESLEQSADVKLNINVDSIGKSITDNLEKSAQSPLKKFSTDFLKSVTGFSIDKLFDQTPTSTKKMSAQYQRILNVYLDNLERSLKTSKIKLDGKNINLEGLLGINPDVSRQTAKKWNNVRQEILTKIERSIKSLKPSDFLLDSKFVKSDQLIGASPEMSKQTAKKWNLIRQDILNKITIAVNKIKPEDVLPGNEKFSLNTILGSNHDDSFAVRRRWSKVRKTILDKIDTTISKDTFTIKPETGKLSINDLLGTQDTDSFTMRRRWKKVRKTILDKVDEAINDKNFTIKPTKGKLTLSELLGNQQTDDIFMRMRWRKIRSNILEKISSSLEKTDVTFAKEGIKISSLFDIPNTDSLLFKFQYLKFRNDVFKKIKKGFDNIEFDGKDISVTDLLGIDKTDKKEPSILQQAILSKIQKSADDNTNAEVPGKSDSKFKSLLDQKAAQEVILTDISSKAKDEITDILKKSSKKIEKEETKKDTGGGLSDMLSKLLGGNLKGLAASLGSVAGYVPIIAAGAAAAYGINKYAKQAHKAQEQEGKTIEALNEKQREGWTAVKKETEEMHQKYGEEFDVRWEKLLKSEKFKKEIEGKTDSTKPIMYLKSLRQIRETLDEKVKYQKRSEEIKKEGTIVSPEAKTPDIIPSKQADSQKTSEQDTALSKETPVDDAPPMQDFIWRKGQAAQPFSSEDNVIGIKSNRKFDEIVSAIKNTKPVEADNTKNIQGFEGVQSELRKLTNMFNRYISIQEEKDTKPNRSTQQTSNLDGVSESDGDVRDPAYILRGRVWDRFNRVHTII